MKFTLSRSKRCSPLILSFLCFILGSAAAPTAAQESPLPPVRAETIYQPEVRMFPSLGLETKYTFVRKPKSETTYQPGLPTSVRGPVTIVRTAVPPAAPSPRPTAVPLLRVVADGKPDPDLLWALESGAAGVARIQTVNAPSDESRPQSALERFLQSGKKDERVLILTGTSAAANRELTQAVQAADMNPVLLSSSKPGEMDPTRACFVLDPRAQGASAARTAEARASKGLQTVVLVTGKSEVAALREEGARSTLGNIRAVGLPIDESISAVEVLDRLALINPDAVLLLDEETLPRAVRILEQSQPKFPVVIAAVSAPAVDEALRKGTITSVVEPDWAFIVRALTDPVLNPGELRVPLRVR